MMDHFSAKLSTLKVTYSLQTNAILVDDEWVDIFEKYNVTVGASLDGPASVNGLNRVYLSGRDSTAPAVKGIRRLQKSPVFAGVICVVQPHAKGNDVVRFFIKDLGLRWFDFLLPDHTHDTLPPDWATTQQAFCEYLISAFAEWYPHSNEGVVCRFFDSVVAGLLGYRSLVDTVGISGLSSVIVETDGTIEPHDVLRVCHGYDRRTGISVGRGALRRFRESGAYNATKNLGSETCPTCTACKVFEICKGGHFAHRYAAANGFANPSVHCAALHGFITFVQRYLGTRLTSVREQVHGVPRPG